MPSPSPPIPHPLQPSCFPLPPTPIRSPSFFASPLPPNPLPPPSPPPASMLPLLPLLPSPPPAFASLLPLLPAPPSPSLPPASCFAPFPPTPHSPPLPLPSSIFPYSPFPPPFRLTQPLCFPLLPIPLPFPPPASMLPPYPLPLPQLYASTPYAPTPHPPLLQPLASLFPLPPPLPLPQPLCFPSPLPLAQPLMLPPLPLLPLPDAPTAFPFHRPASYCVRPHFTLARIGRCPCVTEPRSRRRASAFALPRSLFAPTPLPPAMSSCECFAAYSPSLPAFYASPTPLYLPSPSTFPAHCQPLASSPSPMCRGAPSSRSSPYLTGPRSSHRETCRPRRDPRYPALRMASPTPPRSTIPPASNASPNQLPLPPAPLPSPPSAAS
ncbi:hypothetical protein C7M84_024775 [Penaeus vannamei]|uniref:Uncharacterized protein n=1 Tax=Penaeus vannamei TaxID=6689 RepID=A0A423U026_PENVA|nr:hypothetical protein C7M84_024775 [Penaeus vannamei]